MKIKKTTRAPVQLKLFPSIDRRSDVSVNVFLEDGQLRVVVTSEDGKVLADQHFRVSGLTFERVDTPED